MSNLEDNINRIYSPPLSYVQKQDKLPLVYRTNKTCLRLGMASLFTRLSLDFYQPILNKIVSEHMTNTSTQEFVNNTINNIHLFGTSISTAILIGSGFLGLYTLIPAWEYSKKLPKKQQTYI